MTTRNSFRSAVIVLTVGLQVLAGPAMAFADDIRRTLHEIEWDYISGAGGLVIVPSLPADFFYPGSDPFPSTVVDLQSSTDTVVRRLSGATFPPGSTAPQTIPVEMVQLSLVSVQPITVTTGGVPDSFFDISVDLVQDNGSQFSVVHNLSGPDGGTFVVDSFFDVDYRIEFSQQGTGTPSDGSLNPVSDRLHLDDATLIPWAHRNSSGVCNSIDDDCNFIPGADPANESAPPVRMSFLGSTLSAPLQTTAVVPEPGTMALSAMGLAALVGLAWRRRRRG